MKQFLDTLTTTPEKITFETTIAVIDAHYDFTPTTFRNGNLRNEAEQNNGSCKIFSFAKLHKLTPEQTLHCFGNYYGNDVLKHPQNVDHLNIRNFVQTGWKGIVFQDSALAPKRS